MKHLTTRSSDALPGLARHELKEQDSHSEEVGAVDAFKAFGDDRFYVEQCCAPGSPVAI